jgi:hypothetical protein
MKLPYRARPGLGFGIFAAVAAASTVFFGWGWSRPALDEVWQIQLELRLGTRDALASDERRLLQDTLERHPLLAANMLEDAEYGIISAQRGGMVDMDYAYVVRQTPDAPNVLTISSPTAAPLHLAVRTGVAETTGEAGGDLPFVWAIPDTGPFPQLTEVRLVTGATNDGAGSRKVRPMMVEIRSAQN